MKRFMVFCSDVYYPLGGMKDFKKDFDDVFEAIRYGQTLYFEDWQRRVHVYDLDKINIVYEKNWSSVGIYDLEREQFLTSNQNLLQV